MSKFSELQNIGDFRAGFAEGWQQGWDAHESCVEQAILSADPGYLKWLDKLERLARVQRERDELNEQMNQMAAQAADDEATQ